MSREPSLTSATQRKYRESKNEASAAQNSLEKEITTLRESSRSLQFRLRDTEVANDDFERQARNTTSSIEDLESKYNVAIERGVMLEEEMRLGEQERENLRIDAQRLREELSDVKIEVEVLQDKVRKHESRHLSMISTDISVLGSPTFDKNVENSSGSTASSPLITTPPDTAGLSPSKGPIHDPPSPPMSDASTSLPRPRSSLLKTPAPQRQMRLPSADNSTTPKPRTSTFSSSTSKRPVIRGPSVGTSTRTPANPSTAPRAASHKLPASNSLSHIRSLTAQVQRLEARVHTARSRLPARASTPPRISPAHNGFNSVPSTVTIRSRKRGPSSTVSSSVMSDDMTPTSAAHARRNTQSKHIPRLSTSGVSRLSFGPLPNRGPADDSRPSSRTSMSSSIARPVSRNEMQPPPRPMSRSSLSGARTPLGLSRPRSSLGGSMHGRSTSVSRFGP
ncbi:hypothetical protein IMZ48_30700, partial [Candidatus Bathyarchaeota archaeon]|nr:hypothetical protein [Candidatus Bathyarchaeota archaeon]